MNAKVDAHIARSTRWPDEMSRLQTILLGCGLDEELKWGKPCYASGGRNIAIMQQMNEFLALMFFKGALMPDPAGVLEEQGPNSRSALRIRFGSVDDVDRLAGTLVEYVAAAIAVEDAGLTVDPPPSLVLVGELRQRLTDDEPLRAAFEALTPGRQREYNLHFADAKQASTRIARVDKCAAQILAGKGLRER